MIGDGVARRDQIAAAARDIAELAAILREEFMDCGFERDVAEAYVDTLIANWTKPPWAVVHD